MAFADARTVLRISCGHFFLNRPTYISGRDEMIDFFLNVGQVEQIYTVVDFYTYIKGLEYLICLLFFATFPIFYRYIHGGDNK